VADTIGYIIHGDRDHVSASDVADVFNSIINGVGTAVTIVVITISASWAKIFGKKAIAVTCFALSTLNAIAFYFLPSTAVWGMLGLSILSAVVYAPAIALIWAIYADVADYSEWQTGRRFTGLVFATIGFALKSGLALGSFSLLWILKGFYDYDTKLPDAPKAIEGYRACSGLVVGVLFGICTLLLICYQLNKKTTIQMADELAERRRKSTAQPA
jgi:Na+/melibiose symporter-like transporter